MTRTSWRKRSIAGLVIAAAIAVPGAAQAAAPTLTSVDVFGNRRPGDPGAADPLTGSETLYATSRPFGNRFDMGQLYVVGNADGELDDQGQLLLWIDIVVTDGVRNVTRSVTVQPVDDPDIGRLQGDFNAELPVTQLGVHKTTGTPDSVDPAEWGRSTLTVTVTARNLDDEVSAAQVREITKYAGTPKDTFGPAVTKMTWPPEEWCHLSAPGLQDDFFTGLSFGGTREGRCGELSLGSPFVLPDVSWVACVAEPVPGLNLNSLTRGLFANWQNNACVDGSSSRGPTGSARVSGVIDDYTAPGSQGLASETGDVTIEVLQGTAVLRTYLDQALFRLGPKSGWGITLNINDFEPNNLEGDLYFIRVTAQDAWGNPTVVTSPGITVFPY